MTTVSTTDVTRMGARKRALATAEFDNFAALAVSHPDGYHGEPFEMHLTGAAGGTFGQGSGGEKVEMDALDFSCTLAGRLRGIGVMRIRFRCGPLTGRAGST
ncbi:MAG: hypothetical protein H0V67_07540 [Geodermatophilaceae bacterium]|nr:hypothetical protein [Geodermatophilaceae bacterium]